MKNLQESTTVLTDYEKKVLKRVVETRDKAAIKYPLFGGMLVTFGFVCTLYGFEKLIDKVPLFENNPWILLATGLATLIATGAVYDKLR